MKKSIKKVLFILFIFIALFGITEVKAEERNIKATDITVKDKSGTITVGTPTITDNEISSIIKFNQKDDFVTFELTLKNNESDKYKIESITDNNTNEYLKIDYTFNKDYIKSGATSKVLIKLTYKKQLLNVDKVSLNDLEITFNFTKDDGSSDQIIINPTTGDAILHYLILLIVAITGIIFIVLNKRIKGIKIGYFIFIFSIILLPLGAIAKEKFDISVKFVDEIEIIGEFETYDIVIEVDGVPISKDIKYGDPIGDLPIPTGEEGYEFDKWVDQYGNEVTKDTIITGPITLTPIFKLKNYNITYDLGDGSLASGKTNPSKYTIETDDFTLNNPVLEGYTFVGWTGTGLDTQTTSVTISKGSKNDRSYTAHYSANDDTPYKVTHRYAKLTSGYDEEEVTEYGTTGSTVPAPRQSRTGFVTPTVQNVTIKGDGSASITYTYEREEYAFNITDRTYILEGTTADGTYPYGTSITVKAQERAGYGFEWSDGNSNYERTFELEGVKTLNTVYTPDTNTPYVVKHYKQKLSLDGYEIEDTQNLSGTTDSPISPAVNTYAGFTSPEVQHTTIGGDGHTVVEYYYDREMYTLSFNNNENVTSTKAAGSYPYETSVTLTAKTIAGYTFDKWSNDETSNPYTFTLSGTITIEPEYTANTNTPYTVVHKKQNLNDLTKYTTADTDNLSGTTGTNVTPAVKTYEGFTAPTTQSTTISGNGDTEVEYLYTRNQYALTITHPEYLEEDKSGNYYYEEQVSLTAKDRAGYTFAGWSTGEDTKTITVTMGAEDKIEEPLYTANNDTTYKVIHKYAKLTSGYDEEEITGTGTTGETIPAPRQPREGFVTPNEQNITIAATGDASVTYTYERETYTFSITDRTYLDESVSTPNDTYPYGTAITLKATAREGYTFKWSDNVTNLERTFELTENTTTLSLIYTPNSYTLTANAHGGAITSTEGWTGTGSEATKTITYDSTYGTLPTAERTGYTLAGWNTDEEGTGTNITSSTTVSTTINQTIYAQWVANELVFEPVSKEFIYSTSSQTFNVTPASKGTGTYIYEKTSGSENISVSSNGEISIPANQTVGIYEIYIKAIDSNSGANKTAKYTITIGKKKATLLLGTTPSVTFGTDSTAVYTYDGDGKVSCNSSDTTSITCSVDTSNRIITIHPVKATTSDVTLTISATSGTNYSSPDNKNMNISVSKAACTMNVNNASMYTGSAMTLNDRASGYTGSLSYSISSNGTTNESTIDSGVLTAGAMSILDDDDQYVVVSITDSGNDNYNGCTKDSTITVKKNVNTATGINTDKYVGIHSDFSNFISNKNGGGIIGSITTDNTLGCTLDGNTGITFGELPANDDNDKTVILSLKSHRSTTVAESDDIPVTITVKKYTRSLTIDYPKDNQKVSYGSGLTIASITEPGQGGSTFDITYTNSNPNAFTLDGAHLTAVGTIGETTTIGASRAGTTKVKAATAPEVTIEVKAATCTAPTDLSISTTGAVSWTDSTDASSYMISLNQDSGYEPFANGDIYNDLFESSGAKTVYVKSVCDTSHYNEFSSPIHKGVKIYSVTLSKDTGVESVSGGGLFVNGATTTIEATMSEGYSFTSWKRTNYTSIISSNNPYVLTVSSNYDLTATAHESVAIFDTGSNVNHKIRLLSGDPDNGLVNTTITSFTKSTVKPDISTMTDDNIISTSNSDYPIYAWYDNGDIYWWCDLPVLKLNQNSARMFNGMTNITYISTTSFDTSLVTDMSQLFQDCQNIQTLDLSTWNTTNVKYMLDMFRKCNSLNNLNISSFNTNNVTNMYSMFYGCSSLTSLDLSHFRTNKVTDMSQMFNECTSLTSLNLSNWDTSLVETMRSMFNECNNLTTLSLSHFNTSKVESMYKMFCNCKKLTSLDLSSFDTSNVTDMTNIFSNCNALTTIYASDDFVTTNVPSSINLFFDNRNLVGGNGTTYSSSNPKDVTYARIDTQDNPGYFTRKPTQ